MVAGEQLADDGIHSKLVHSSAKGRQYLWSGFVIELLGITELIADHLVEENA